MAVKSECLSVAALRCVALRCSLERCTVAAFVRSVVSCEILSHGREHSGFVSAVRKK